MSSNYGLTDEDLSCIRDVLTQHTEVERALIFGSRAKGNFNMGSDVDIALIGKAVDTIVARYIDFELNEETSLPYRFDVLDYKSIQEPDLLQHIDRRGAELYVRESYPG